MQARERVRIAEQCKKLEARRAKLPPDFLLYSLADWEYTGSI